jgi:hypothetical protein
MDEKKLNDLLAEDDLTGGLLLDDEVLDEMAEEDERIREEKNKYLKEN